MVLYIPQPSTGGDGSFVELNDVGIGGVSGLIGACAAGSATVFAATPVVDADTTEVGGYLRVLQGELAVAEPGDGPVALGSDSATTCHIVGIRDPSSGRTCLAHMDKAEATDESVEIMLGMMAGGRRGSGDQPFLDIYVVGGYLGEPMAEDMSERLLMALKSSPQAFRVKLACIGRVNSKPLTDGKQIHLRREGEPGGEGREGIVGHTTGQAGQGEGRRDETSEVWAPVVRSLAICLSSGEAFPICFEGAARGDAWEIRQARISSHNRPALTEAYDRASDSIVVHPFSLSFSPVHLRALVTLPDTELLRYTSTSPLVEEARFPQETRRVLAYILKHGAEGGGGRRARRPGGEGGGRGEVDDDDGGMGVNVFGPSCWRDNVFGEGGGKPLIIPRSGAGSAAGSGCRGT